MNRDDAVKALDAALTNMQKGGRYTPEDVDELERCARDALDLLKAQDKDVEIIRKCRDGEVLKHVGNGVVVLNFEWWRKMVEKCDHIKVVPSVEDLLKAQEPRVMTFDEVKKHYNLPPAFPDDLEMQEDYYQDIQPLYFEYPNTDSWDVHWRNSDKVRTYLDGWEDRYNKTWRCWTSRPTDEQREAVKWDE